MQAPRPAPAAQTDLTVAERLTREERELLAAYRRLRNGSKVGAIVIQWNGLVTQVLATLPTEVIGV